MMTLCIRYKFNPKHLSDLNEYFEKEQPVIERSGGSIIGYFLPTDFAGANDEAIGLIDVPSLAAYEAYRAKLAADPVHKENVARLMRSGAEVVMHRSFIRRVAGRG
jgi:hypothetical protein